MLCCFAGNDQSSFVGAKPSSAIEEAPNETISFGVERVLVPPLRHPLWLLRLSYAYAHGGSSSSPSSSPSSSFLFSNGAQSHRQSSGVSSGLAEHSHKSNNLRTPVYRTDDDQRAHGSHGTRSDIRGFLCPPKMSTSLSTFTTMRMSCRPSFKSFRSSFSVLGLNAYTSLSTRTAVKIGHLSSWRNVRLTSLHLGVVLTFQFS